MESMMRKTFKSFFLYNTPFGVAAGVVIVSIVA